MPIAERTMYKAIERYFVCTACRGIWVTPRFLVRIVKNSPDVLVWNKDNTLVAIEAKRELTQHSLSYALGQCSMYKTFATKIYLAFPEPIAEWILQKTHLVSPEFGIMQTTATGEAKIIREAEIIGRHNENTVRTVIEACSKFANKRMATFLADRGIVVENDDDVQIPFGQILNHWYDRAHNTVHIAVDDSINDDEDLDQSLRWIDREIRNLDLREKFGDNVQIEIESEIFSMCRQCGFVKAGVCRQCTSSHDADDENIQ